MRKLIKVSAHLNSDQSVLLGLINMLTYVLGEMDMTENVQQMWSKIYRVMEQAIIANIVRY